MENIPSAAKSPAKYWNIIVFSKEITKIF